MNHFFAMSFGGEDLVKTTAFLTFAFKQINNYIPNYHFECLYIGTAREDKIEDAVFFTSIIKSVFGFRVNIKSLELTRKDYSKDDFKRILENTDLIFISGGNTKFLLERWQETGFSAVLEDFKDRDRLPIISGVSAGSMCFFNSGISDYKDEEYNILKGLNWLQESFTAHCNDLELKFCPFANKNLNRLDAHKTAVKEELIPKGYAINDYTILHFYNKEYKGECHFE